MLDFLTTIIIMNSTITLEHRMRPHSDTTFNTSRDSIPRPPPPPRRDYVACLHHFFLTISIQSALINILALLVRYNRRDASDSLRFFQIKNEYTRFSKYLHDLAGLKTLIFYGGTPIQENINEYARFSKYDPDVKAWIFRGGTSGISGDAPTPIPS